MAGLVAVEAGDGVAPEDHRAVDAHEQGRIEILLELGDGAVDQPGARADVEAHIIALGGDPLDVGGGDPDQAIMVGHPEFLDMAGARPRPCLRPPAT